MISSEEKKIAKTIEKVMPAVVTVVITKKATEVKKELKLKDAEIPPSKIDARGMVQVGGGSGFVVDSKGIILTNKHVVSEPNSNYKIITADNKDYAAEIIAGDPVNDVAILGIKQESKLPFINLGDSDKLRLGETALAFGNALGLFKNTVSKGIISGLSRTISARETPSAPVQEMRGMIQTDAAINIGNSGGPLTNQEGNVIGINSAVAAGAQSIGFAIPINMAKRDLDDLKKYGKIKRPLLGIKYLTLNKDLGEKLNLPVSDGAYITGEHSFDKAVVPNGPADKAGLKEGDVILEWDNNELTTEKTIQDFLENCAVGQKVKIKFIRNKRGLETEIELAERK